MGNEPKPKKTKKKKKKTEMKQSESESYHADPHCVDDYDLAAELVSYAQTAHAQYEKPWDKYEKRNANGKTFETNVSLKVNSNGNANAKWGAAGNEKCHCGSGKKYKKCCKKRD